MALRHRRRSATRAWAVRLGAAAWLGGLLIVVAAAAAFAVDCPTPTDTTPDQVGDSWTWGPYLTDTRCVPLGRHGVFVDPGSLFTNVFNLVWSFTLNIFWAFYKVVAVFGISVLDFVLSFDWLDPILGPLSGIATSLHQVVTGLHVVPTLLTITAVVAVVMMARGRWAGGIYELSAALLISVLAVGILANPLRSVSEDDGLLDIARNTGMQIADRLAGVTTAAPNEEPAARAAAREAAAVHGDVIAAMGSTFVRAPAQLVSFGKVLTGGCADAYDEAVADPQALATGSTVVLDAVAACDEDAGEVANNPGPGQIATLLVIGMSGLVMLGFTTAMAIAVVVATLWVLFQAVKAVIALVVGLLPGRARGMLWMTAADLIVALLTIVVLIVFLTGTLLIIEAVFAADGAVMGRFLLVDILLVGSLALWWRIRRSLTRTSDRLAEALGSRPSAPQRNGGTTAMPTREPVITPVVGTAVKAGTGMLAWRRLGALKGVRSAAGAGPASLPASGAGPAADTPGPTTGGPPPPSPSGGPATPSATPGPDPAGTSETPAAGGARPDRSSTPSAAVEAVAARIKSRQTRAALGRAALSAATVVATGGTAAPAVTASAAGLAALSEIRAPQPRRAAHTPPADPPPNPATPSPATPGSATRGTQGAGTRTLIAAPPTPTPAASPPVSPGSAADSRARLIAAVDRAARRGQAAARTLRRS